MGDREIVRSTIPFNQMVFRAREAVVSTAAPVRSSTFLSKAVAAASLRRMPATVDHAIPSVFVEKHLAGGNDLCDSTDH